MTSLDLSISINSFTNLVRKSFHFLEEIGGLSAADAKLVDTGSARDRAFCLRYRRPDLRVDVAWNEFERSFSILIRYDREDLDSKRRYVYCEPFIEFLTGGAIKAIVPYLRHGMSYKGLLSVMNGREALLSHGIGNVISKVGERFGRYFSNIESASSDVIRDYHEWMKL